MSDALVRTLSLLLLILVGFLLKGKIPKNQRAGVKQIILGLALPAVIFISLQNVEFSLELILMPVLAIAFNFIMFFLTGVLAPVLGIDKDSPNFRTARILIPSLAPGLSCFPFLLEYLGDEALANAAFADVGNKVFVLVVLYAVAMKWFYQVQEISTGTQKGRIIEFLKIMLKEPVNLAIISALIFVALDINYTVFPDFLRISIDKLGSIMTPLIMLFIGLSVSLSWHQTKIISTILFLRSGLAFLLSGLVILVFQISDPALVLLVILFPQSSSSFWPYLHIESIANLELELKKSTSTFNSDFAMNVLAMSLPFSTLVILSICTFQNSVNSTTTPFYLAGFMVFSGLIPVILRQFRGVRFEGSVAKSEPNN